MTRTTNTKNPNPRNDVKVGVDKGTLRIQFSRPISKLLFGVKQKYFYLGLTDTPENWSTANGIAERIQNDIRANKLEKNLDAYSPVSELKEKVGIFYDPHRIEITTLELFNGYCIFIKPQLKETTYECNYTKTFYNFLSEAPQDLNQQPQLVDFLYHRCGSHSFVTVVNLLSRMVEWAQKRGMVPAEAPNCFKKLKADYKVVHRSRKVPKLLRKIQPGYYKDKDYTAFARDEATCVINAFIEYADVENTPVKGRPLLDKDRYIRAGIRDMVQFSFWTGCRTCEASGLRWIDIDENYEFVYFRHGYSTKLKILTPLKTEHVGEDETKARKVPCGQKLASLLESRKRLVYKGDDMGFVFPHSEHSPYIPLNNSHLRYHWYGCENKQTSKDGNVHEMFYPGVVLQLAADNKISQYLNPYATRHTWITLQLIEGVPIKNIAKLAGNTPEVILKNYASYVPDFNLAPEI